MSSQDPADNDDQLNDAVVAYLESVEAGRPADRARYPELADFFADADRVERWASPLREMARVVKDSVSDPDDTHAYESAATPKPMASFGDYEIVAELGRGGMGVVYKAFDVKLKRFVAIKTLRAGVLVERENIDRFLAEARAVARMQHPNIVQVYDIGEHAGLPYISFEYLEGGTLAARLKG